MQILKIKKYIFYKKYKNKKTHKAYCDYWVARVQWMDLKTLNI